MGHSHLTLYFRHLVGGMVPSSGGKILIGCTNIGAEEGPGAAGLPMLGPRFLTAAAWEGGARMTLCATGGGGSENCQAASESGAAAPQRERPAAGQWGGGIVTTQWRPCQQRCTWAGRIEMDLAAFRGWV